MTLFLVTFASVIVAARAWDNGAALTPPMGFANWNVFGCDYDDKLFREMADAFVSLGLRDVGYQYMLVQECIVKAGARDPVTGVVQPDVEKFPHGLADLASYFHSKGLLAGIYTDVKSITCAGYEGSGPGPGVPSHWALDALTYAQWGFDMIEADFCNPSGSNASAFELYSEARDAIAAATAATGRVIAFYQCNWGEQSPWLWGPQTANLFRNTGDICGPGSIAWERIVSNFDNTIVHSGTPGSAPGEPGTGIGAWNDPDMLGVGMNGINDVEGRSQFSLWCILGAPLFLGTDVRNASATTLATISNAEAIAVNQNLLGVQGYSIDPTPAGVPYEGGLLLNLTSSAAAASSWNISEKHVSLSDGGACVTVVACETAPGSPVFSFACIENDCGNELWEWKPAMAMEGGAPITGTLVTAGSGAGAGLCLSAVDPATAPLSALVVDTCGASSASVWSYDVTSGSLSVTLPGGAPLFLTLFGGLSVNMYVKPLLSPTVAVMAEGDVSALRAAARHSGATLSEALRGGSLDLGLAILNRGASDVEGQRVDLTALGFSPAQGVLVRDIWANTTSAPVKGSFTTRGIGTHETLLLRLSLAPV